jgi:hypothetical protein
VRCKAAVEIVESLAAHRALWVIDRGADRRHLHLAFRERGVRYLLRATRRRTVYRRGKRRSVGAVAAATPLRDGFTLAHRGSRGEWNRVRVRYGWRKIEWEQQSYWLITVAGVQDENFI